MYGLIYSGGEGQNGQRTTLVRIDAAPTDDDIWYVMRVKDDGSNRSKRGLKVNTADVVYTWPALPSTAERSRVVALLNAPHFDLGGAA